MNLFNRFFLFAFCLFSAVTCHAGFDRLFTPAGEGTLPEKLVVTASDAVLYKDFNAESEKIPPLTILWRLKDKNAKDPKNPIVINDGKEYYCVGSPKGNKWGYIETAKVTKWMTRFVYTPLPSSGDSAFRVFNKPFSKKEFAEASDKQIEEATVAVPTGYLAFVLNDEDSLITNQQKQGITTDPNDFKKVMMYNFSMSAGTTDRKVLGYACSRTNKDTKCASLCVLVLREELEDFEDSLNQAYRRLNKLYDGGSGKIEVIYDVFMEEYIGFLSGSATDDDYEKNFEGILSQMPVKTPMLKMTFKDVMEMNEIARAKWLTNIKDARDRVKSILNQKERWIKTYTRPDGHRQEFILIPVEDLP